MNDGPAAPWWAGLRAVPLAFLATPLVPALFLALAGGHGRLIGGCIAGLAGIGFAMARLRRARRRDVRRAAILLGVGTGLAAGLAGGTGPIGGVVLGLMAFAGARLLYDRAGTEALPRAEWRALTGRLRARWAARRDPPVPAPVATPADPLRGRLLTLRGADPRLLPAVDALDRLSGEIALRPRQGVEARRVLVLGVDGLDRIAARLSTGAAAPADLPATVEDLARAADGAADGLRGAETEALEIQVKVLRDRLREESRA